MPAEAPPDPYGTLAPSMHMHIHKDLSRKDFLPMQFFLGVLSYGRIPRIQLLYVSIPIGLKYLR